MLPPGELLVVITVMSMINVLFIRDPLQFMRRLVGKVRNRNTTEQGRIFTIRQNLEDAHTPIKRGVFPITLEKITGSVGRPHDFHNLTKRDGSLRDERLLSILKAMKAGKKMPPIALYQIKDDFFIVDGHHRFKAALELGLATIEANVVELIAR